MKTLDVAAALVGAVALLLLCAWFGAPAEGAADSRPCVTASEWSRVDVGMTRAEVRSVLDGDGHLGESVGVRWYRVCGKAPRHVRAFVWYRDQGRTMDGGLWIETR